NGFVQVNSEKMAKSLGNFSTIQDLLVEFPADAIRLLLLQTKYRNPIDFTQESLIAARTSVQRLTRAVMADAESNNGGTVDPQQFEFVRQQKELFMEAMNDDFHTPGAVPALFALADRVFQTREAGEKKACVSALRELSGVLGFALVDTRQSLDTKMAGKIVDFTLELRNEARKRKDFATADQIRKGLTDLGINVMDTTGGGSTWERS
ncbi:MAG: DALR domain-containing protein, partial [Terriglobales bacterium]